jgi:hypothetical protein
MVQTAWSPMIAAGSAARHLVRHGRVHKVAQLVIHLAFQRRPAEQGAKSLRATFPARAHGTTTAPSGQSAR